MRRARNVRLACTGERAVYRLRALSQAHWRDARFAARARTRAHRLADDIKALLIAGVLHRQGCVELHAVVANGGAQAARRAQLARAVLDHIGADAVPVGIGTDGKPGLPQPHEFSLLGFDSVDTSRLVDGAELLLRVLRSAARRSLTIVCISSLRDLADIIAAEPQLVADKVCEVAIQGGVELDGLSGEWTPDTCARARRRAAASLSRCHSCAPDTCARADRAQFCE